MFLDDSIKMAVENLCEGVILVNKCGEICMINKAAEELLDITKENHMGKSIDKVISQTQIPHFIESKENEFCKSFFFNGREFITSRITITIKGEVQGALAIFQDVDMYNVVHNEITQSKIKMDILNTIMNSVNECVVVVNKDGIITMMSKSYKEFIKCESPEGKHVVDIIENTRLHKIIETGTMEIGDLQEMQGKKLVSMRVPIKKDGKVIGAIGKIMFKDIGDFYSLSKKLSNLQKEVEFYKNKLSKDRKAIYSFDDIIGHSSAVMEVKTLGKRVGNSASNVLIIGESGTGKELFAHSIHNCSKRFLGPFIKINCAAIPAELLEAELFGYEEGAFTGAKKGGKKGKFELANNGTIFLDEIGDMPINMQVKLLRVIQEKEIERVGGNVLKEIDVRIIAASNRNLEAMIIEGKFREDLYYRLNVMKILLPPLRDRKDDIPELSNSLRIKVANRLGMYVEGISKEAIECLMNYDWPGNIRELENVIERGINLLDSDLVIQPEHLPERLKSNKFKSYVKEGKYLKDIVEDIEKDVILDYLKKNNWNKNKTAKLLGISRAGLYKKIEYYKLYNV